MRRLSFLLLALALALVGAHVVTSAEQFSPALIRDGLVLGGLGALIFALNVAGWRAPLPFKRVRTVPRPGQMTLLTGLIVALLGGLIVGFGLPGFLGLWPWFAWGLGLVLIAVGSWWPGGEIEYALPAVRWTRDGDGNVVPVAATNPDAREAASWLGRRAVAIWLLVILAVAAALRFWNLAELPPGCVADECANGLRLVDGQPLVSALSHQFNLFEHLARLALRVVGEGVPSLRIAAAILGWLTVVCFFGAARRLASPPNALLATALLALSPWHLWASRSSDPWILVGLLATLALWFVLEALARANVRWWVMAGAALGLLYVETPPLRWAVAGWLLAVIVIGLIHRWRSVDSKWSRYIPVLGLVTAVAVAMPALASATRAGQLLAPPTAGAGLLDNLGTLLGALLRPDATTAGPFTQAGLLVSLTFALALLGVGALLRHVRQPAAAATVIGSTLLLWLAAQLDLTAAGPASVLLALLPFFFAFAALALDRLIAALVYAWGPPLLRPVRLAATVALLVVLITGRSTLAFMSDLDAIRTSGDSQIETDTARFVAQWLVEHPDSTTTFVVPRTTFSHPSLRLLAGSALASGHIQPLELAHTLPFAAAAPGDLLYVVPVQDTQLLELLRQLYPMGAPQTQLDESGARALFTTYQVTQQEVAQAQNLQMMVFPGSEPDVTAATLIAPVDSLDFAWADSPPADLPFNAKWTGSLVVPEAGNYIFNVDSSASDAAFSLTLDDLLLLDTGLPMTRLEMPLAQGVYRLAMTYRSGAQPGDLRVRWQRPDAADEVIQGPLLHVPTLPDQGLLGTYYGNDQFDNPPITRRKDPIIGMDPGLMQPYSVRWEGKLAAPRAGEYLISAVANGISQVTVDGQLVLDNSAAVAQKLDDAGYTEGLIYLTAGWHPLEVRYAPGEEAPAFSLLWQPAGGQPEAIASAYLLPAQGEIGPIDAPLPPAPALADVRLGNDQFALSRASDVWQPKVRIPAVTLPPLPLESLWVAGNGCGPAEDQFAAPHGLAFSPDGSQLYVADTGNKRIKIYDVDGGLHDVITGEQLQEPVDVEMASDGRPFVLDATTQAVYHIDADNTLTAQPLKILGFYHPRGFGVDANGNLLVADTGGGRIVVVEQDGVVAGEFGGQGSLLARGQPVDAAATAAAIWAITAEDGRLWNLATDGSLTAVQPNNTIDGPHLAALPDGRLVATDPGRATFILFSDQGQPVGEFGYPGQFALPTGIAATPVGDATFIAVSDTRQCTVSLWRLAQ